MPQLSIKASPCEKKINKCIEILSLVDIPLLDTFHFLVTNTYIHQEEYWKNTDKLENKDIYTTNHTKNYKIEINVILNNVQISQEKIHKDEHQKYSRVE